MFLNLKNKNISSFNSVDITTKKILYKILSDFAFIVCNVFLVYENYFKLIRFNDFAFIEFFVHFPCFLTVERLTKRQIHTKKCACDLIALTCLTKRPGRAILLISAMFAVRQSTLNTFGQTSLFPW